VVSNKGKNTDKAATVFTLSLPISAKSPKEVVEILKFFKIKETFPNLQNKKIENIQKIISGEGKSKPCLNMTTRGPSQKQVIVPMNTTSVMNLNP